MVDEGSSTARCVTGAERLSHVLALDGLRGVAVALVVLYHFAPDLLPAGFLGVDVFFVLSGFLITSLALGEIHSAGSVVVGAFFARRARRLLPAALVTIVVSVGIAMVLDSDAYRSSLRGQAIASILYVNNWWAIAQNETYQAVFGAESPLTHFWSLSIEEQFYLLFPFVLVGLVALARSRSRSDDRSRRLARSLVVLGVIGSIASATTMAVLYDPLRDPSRLYYGTDTRLQAVLVGVVGGSVVWLRREGLRSRISGRLWSVLAGLAVIGLLVASRRGGFLQSWLYRGGFFALALAAVVVVVSVVVHRGVVARVLEIRFLVTLGIYSYGIYLWHWPVKVFLDQGRTGLSGPGLFTLRVAVTAVLTIVSARLIEAPFRSPRTGSESTRLHHLLRAPRGAFVAVAAMVVAVFLVVVIARPVRISYANSVDEAPVMAASPSGPLRVMWTGDSFAWTLGGGDLQFPQPQGYENVLDPNRIVYWNLASYPCTLIPAISRSMGAVRSTPARCWSRATTWPEQIEAFRPDVVLWSGALFDLVDVNIDGKWIAFGSHEWDVSYLDALDAARRVATASGATFVILEQNDPRSDPREEFNEALLPENVWRFAHLRELQRDFAEEHPDDTRSIDLQSLLCAEDSCPETTITGVPMRPDGVHWSLDGARAVAPAITSALYRVMDRPIPS